MILKNNFIVFANVLVLVLFACEKDELPIQPQQRGETTQHMLSMGDDYKNQLFFDLASNTVISSNDKSIWDLAFENGVDGKHITLNTAKGMAIHHSSLPLNSPVNTDDLEWRWDAHTGNLDSTATGEYWSQDFVYVVDRGYNHEGIHAGYFKFSVETVDAESYTIKTANIDGTGTETIVVYKSDIHGFTYFSFSDGTVSVAPEDTSYDLVFTQYTYLFTDPVMPYLVTGVLLNRTHTTAMRVENKSFEEVTIEDMDESALSNRIDMIGYDWKYYHYEDAVYVVDPGQIFIVKTNSGQYFKLHFIGFYNESGLKGYPLIEFKEL